MKKIYTLTLAVVTAVSASAALNVQKVSSPEAVDVNSSLKVRTAIQSSERPAKLPAADYDSYEWVLLGQGKYAASVIADTYSSSTTPVDVDVYEAKGHSGVYKAVGVWSDLVDNASLIVDASDPNFITVPKQFTGIIDNVDNETYIASQAWVLSEERGYDPSLIIEAVPEILPTLENGCINFPAPSLLLNWPNAPANSQYETDPAEWYGDGNTAGYLVLPGGQYVDPWTILGEGTFSGDVYFSSFGATPADYKVNVYQSKSDENLYRVEDPLKGLYSALGFQAVSPSWDIEAKDANNISIPIVSSGINGGTDGIYYVATYNQAMKDVTAAPEEYRSSLVKEEKKLTFKFPAKGLVYWASGSGITYYGNSAPATLTVEIQSSGIDDIISESDINAPVEFFNLQGQRIEKPASGQLVLKRQGRNVTKVIVK